MWLNLRTEYSFGAVYGPVKEVVANLAERGAKAAGIADISGTWGHVRWKEECEKNKIKPIFGVRLWVTEDLSLKERRQPRDLMSFIALTDDGLKLIYKLVDMAHTQFYYLPRISYHQLNQIPEKDVAIIGALAPRFDLINRHIYLELSPATPLAIRKLKKVDYVACCDNWMMKEDDVETYEPFAEDRKLERKTTPVHILSDKDWKKIFPKHKKPLKNRDKILKNANAKLKKAKMVKYPGKEDINLLCKIGAREKGINLRKEPYKSRYKKEMKLIKEKGYVDYFLVVWDFIKYAKKHMLVGHSRGSSAGSLVCYLLHITEIDPIEYNLVFERFIDVNRFDLPDIDIDFQDNKRHMGLKYLQKKYGRENVAQIGNVNRLQPKSAITRFAKAMEIPPWEVDEVKDAIVERSGGDARAALCILDTFEESDAGKQFIKAYPNMKPVANIEAHASHTGVHAAGILVCNEPITNFCGVNSRDGQRIAMIDKKDAEKLDLLKIDALGLRNLTIIAETCDAVGIKYNDLYSLDLTDKKAYKVFKKQRLIGIFQFEGDAVRNLAKQMPVENIMDISAISALGRPGPLATGGATTFVNRRSKREKTKYMSSHKYIVDQTKETFGVIIYQEQVMDIGRIYGGLSWSDVTDLRKAMSKSLGDEFFGKYKKKFIDGAVKNGASEKDAEVVWKNMNTMGSWSFNKSHAVSYGMITYICAYLKAHYPLEFAVASLNNAKSDRSAVKLLRDMRENDKIKHKAYSKSHSELGWTVYKKRLLGGLTAIDGVGPGKAKQVLKIRRENHSPKYKHWKDKLTPGLRDKLENGITPFKYLYPAKQIYGDYYQNPSKYVEDMKIDTISELETNDEYCIIGCITKKVVRDANEAILVSKRGYRVDGETTYINMALEDDTGAILATIGREDYNSTEYETTGKEIAESGKIDKDWFLAYGTYDTEWNRLYIKNIRRITKDE